MKKIIFNISVPLILIGIILNSCNKKLDLEPQQNIDVNKALVSVQDINNALNSTYAALKASSLYGRDMLVLADALSDRAFSNGKGARFVTDNQNATNAPFGFWTAAYSAINEANLILEVIPTSQGDAATKARWEGELLFLRALLHFSLAKTYAYIPTYVVSAQDKGGIVIKNTGVSTIQQAADWKPKRASINETYDFIMADLYKSLSFLSNANRGAYYASKLSSLALGSRVALYMGNYNRADSFATAAIAAGGIGTMTNTTNHVSGWRLALNPESIFEVRIATLPEVPSGIANQLQGALTNIVAIGNTSSSNGGFGPLVPNMALMTELRMSFSPSPNTSTLSFGTTIPTITRREDVRSQLYDIGPNVSGRHIECTKFLGKNGTPGVDNVPVVRWAELYLNRAEARARMATPNTAGANADLNIIRSNRIMGFTTPADITGPALMDSISRHRAIEFAFEGHRWFDMKRWGLPIVKTTPVVSFPNTYFRYLNIIPTTEVDGNPNMVQNFGF